MKNEETKTDCLLNLRIMDITVVLVDNGYTVRVQYYPKNDTFWKIKNFIAPTLAEALGIIQQWCERDERYKVAETLGIIREK